MNGTKKIPEIYVCALPNKQKYEIVRECGIKNGARLIRDLGDVSIHFADQDWKNPNLDKYVKLVEKYKPYTATVLDYESHVHFDTVWNWYETIAPHVEQIIIIPKVPGAIGTIPTVCSGKEIILGFSIPTKYSGTLVDPKEFYGRKIHLLGGSPRKQIQFFIDYYEHMDIVSIDNNYIQMKANKFIEYWIYTQVLPLKSKWVHNSGTKETVKQRTDDAFRMSLINFREYWKDLGKQLWSTS